MGKLWRRAAPNDNAAHGMREIDLAALRIEQPTVIFLTGFFTYDDTPEHIRAAFRNISELTTATPQAAPAEILVWSHAGLSEIFNVAAYDALPNQFSSRNGYNLSRGVIMPLVAKHFAMDAKGNVTGRPLPLEEARKNLRNVTFFGYSAGTITAQECFIASIRMMKKIGYSEKDARALLHEVALVSVGVMSRPGREKDRFTTLYLEATNDRVVSIKNRMWTPLRAVFDWFARGMKIRDLSAHSTIIKAPVRKKDKEKRVRDGKTVEKEIRGMLPKWFPLKSNHELPRYVTEDDSVSPFARMVEYSLANAVTRDRLLTPMELLAPPADAPAQVADAYRAKIAKAVRKPK
ncbi:MAG TPA: hypothetical protein VEF76_01750 [Patescibacteria group bacterium]|nr:hypothetical protein [Patescibacteria group bacterium]